MEIGGRKRKMAAKNHDIWEKKNHRAKKKTQWYNKNMYGGYGYMIRTLSAGMTDQELARIRSIIAEAQKEFKS